MKVIYHPEVEQVIRTLPEKDNTRVIQLIDFFEDYKFALTPNFLKKITEEIWELRAGRYRLLFGIVKSNVAIVVIFMKKTQKTPKQMIKLATQRLKEYEK